MKEKLADIWKSMKAWPIVVKIAIGICIVAVIVGIVVTVKIVNGSKEEIAELPSEAVATEVESERQIEPETESEKVVEEPQEALPVFTTCTVEVESLERNLDVYFMDNSGIPITGVAFEVKLLPSDGEGKITQTMTSASTAETDGEEVITDLPAQSLSLQETIDQLTQIEDELEEMEKLLGSTDFNREDYEQLLIQKKRAIASYTEALNADAGRFYTDEDKDGGIHINDISGGSYVLCIVPVANPKGAVVALDDTVSAPDGDGQEQETVENLYDAGTYAMDVKVKSQVDHTVLKFIENQIVDESAAGDKEETHSDIKVQKTKKDTASYSEEFSLEQSSDYTKLNIDSSVLKVKAAVSDQMKRTEGSAVPAAEGTQATENAEAAAGDGQTNVSSLAVSESVALYANKEGTASTADIFVQTEHVENLEVQVPEELSDHVALKKTDGGYQISLKGVADIEDDENGILRFTGIDATGNPISAECSLSIVGGSRKLKYNNKDLYVEGGKGKMVRATVANYGAKKAYYIKEKNEKVSYYGWHTEGNKHYFYDSDGKKVKGKQTIGGVDYTFDEKNGKLISGGAVVDVSSWNGDIDWEQAAFCLKAVMVRCGFRGTSGKLAIDSKCLLNVGQARKNGVSVGIYFHSRATSTAQAVEEASLAVAMAKKAGNLNLPIYLELDSDKQGSLSESKLTSIVRAFCSTVGNGGYKAGVSAGKDTLTNKLDTSALSNCSVWCIEYNTKCTYKGTYSIWQYSRKGKLPGFTGNVNLNVRK